MKTILLKLSAPMQSWGVDSHYNERHTNRFPTKSGVIGMLAAALGYRRDEDAKLKQLRQLQFAVRIDQPGEILRDYQTAHRHKPDGTPFNALQGSYLLNRYYLSDAVFVVALSSDDEELIHTIKTSLQHPYFGLYLGRRSCPINFDFLLHNIPDENQGAIMNLQKLPWQAASWYQQQCHQQDMNPVYICADGNLVQNTNFQTVNDVPYSFAQGNSKSPFNHYDRRIYQLRAIGYLYQVKLPS